MLKSITVQNFAYFKDRQTLNFEHGAYFMIGENDSGKTSLFEIIRGCMSAPQTITQLTNPHDCKRPSFALCCFQDGKEKQRVLSVLMRWKTDHDEICLKLIHVSNTKRGDEMLAAESKREQEKPETFEAVYRKRDTDWHRVSFGASKDFREALLRELGKPSEDISGDLIFQVIEPHFKSMPGTLEESGESGTNDCETHLKMYVNESTVVTFPMRGISTCQWTKSESLKHEKSYSEEIITWYLTQRDISQDEKKNEHEYFKLITNNSGVEFNYADKKLVVTNDAFQDQESSMLTISEGIYAAKKLSVLLAVKRFKTVCLEEPDRGMHPQMIERIRDLVLPQIKEEDKIVLITTHHPSFLSPSTLPLVYSFRRRFEGNRCIATVRLLLSEKGGTIDKSNEHDGKTQGACGIGTDHPGPSKAKSKKMERGKKENDEAQPEHEDMERGKKENDEAQPEHEDKTVRLVTSGASPLLFFATKLLLVEGQGDCIFMFHLRQVLMTKTKLLQFYIGQIKTLSPRKIEEEMKQFLCSLHVVPMIGEANKDKYFKFCKRIETLAFFLMDKDALTNNIPGHKPDDKSPRDFLKMFGLDHDDSSCKGVQNDVRILEKDRLFLWKGTIEHAVASLADIKDVKDCFDENNVQLEYNNLNKGKKPRKKLFSDKQLTNQNIREVVEKIVEASKGNGKSEFHRLIMFLIKMRNHSFKDT